MLSFEVIESGKAIQIKQGYWERAADNLAHWLGLQHLTTVDILILQPLFPLLALDIAWWLPWERWLWKDLPQTISGPYLLYCAFAPWHFHAHWRLVTLVAIVGAGLCALALKDSGKLWRRPEP